MLESNDHSDIFSASNALYDSCDNITDGQGINEVNFWMPPDKEKGASAYFVIELNCEQELDRVILKNAQNVQFKDR